MTTIDLDRGERNCNPGNIERQPGNDWLGLAPDQSSDPRFCVFTETIYGVRALAKVLLAYQRHHGCDTIEKIITRWAPGNENDTEAYVDEVAMRLGVAHDARVNLDIPTNLAAVSRAIIRHENGRVLPGVASTIGPAISMALGLTLTGQ